MAGMSALAWTFAGLLVAVVALLGAALFFAISRIDLVSDRIDLISNRMDQTSDRIDQVGGRIDHLGVRLDGRIDETNRRIDDLHASVLSGFTELGGLVRDLDRRLSATGT